jgi:hypothetical protein
MKNEKLVKGNRIIIDYGKETLNFNARMAKWYRGHFWCIQIIRPIVDSNPTPCNFNSLKRKCDLLRNGY